MRADRRALWPKSSRPGWHSQLFFISRSQRDDSCLCSWVLPIPLSPNSPSPPTPTPAAPLSPTSPTPPPQSPLSPIATPQLHSPPTSAESAGFFRHPKQSPATKSSPHSAKSARFSPQAARHRQRSRHSSTDSTTPRPQPDRSAHGRFYPNAKQDR